MRIVATILAVMVSASVAISQCGAPAPIGDPMPCDPGYIPGVGFGYMDAIHCPLAQQLVLWAYLPTGGPLCAGYFVGGQVRGLTTTPFVSGKLCMGLPAYRYRSYPVASNVNGSPAHLPLASFVPGDTWYFQCWWRELDNGRSAFTDARMVVIP